MAKSRSGLVPLAIAAASSTLLSSLPAQAQEQDETPLGEVVVTARYREENLQTTPIAITAISSEQLEIRNLKSVDDLGLAIPNAYFRQPISNFGPTNVIGLRGLIQGDFNYAFEPTVGLYIDDVYHGTLTGSSMDLTDLERVEVLRGPQGTLFGKNTMGGAVRLISRKPQGDGTGSIEVTYGQRDRIDVRAVGDWAVVPEKLFARVTGVSKQQDGYGQFLDFTCEMIRRGTPELAGLGDGLAADNANANPMLGIAPDADTAPDVVAVGSPADNAFAFPQTIDPRQGSGCKLGDQGGSSSNGARLALRWLASEKLEVNLGGEFSNLKADPPVETQLTRRVDNNYSNFTIFPKYGIQIDDRFITGDPYSSYATYGNAVDGTQYDSTTKLDVWGVNGTIDYAFTEKTRLKFISAYRTYDTTWVNDSDLTPFELIQTNYLQEHEQFQAEAQLSGLLLGDKLEWTTGAFYYDSESRAYNTANFVTFGLKFVADDRFTSENQSAFVHLNYQLTDSLSISGGARYSDETKSNLFQHIGLVPITTVNFGGDHFDYMVGLDWQASDNLFFYTQTATGFQSAGVTPRVFTLGQIQSLPGEEVTNYEIGAKFDLFDRKLRINSAVFYMDYAKRLVNVAGVTQCNLSSDPDPGPPFFLGGPGTLCPATTPAGALPAPTGPGPDPRTGSPWFLYQNAPGTVQGFESEIQAFPLADLAINASVGYNEFEGDQTLTTAPNFRDESALLQPEWNISAGVQYGFNVGGAGRITPRLDWYYQGYRTNGTPNLPQRDPDDIVPSFGLWNARINYDTADGDWQLGFSVTNLSDKFYWQQLGSATQRSGAPTVARVGTAGRPREWAISFKKNFD
jgi:iron complex outermembrane receptor protein